MDYEKKYFLYKKKYLELKQKGGIPIPVELRGDKMAVITAVKLNGMDLEYASIGLRKDKEVVLAAVSNNGMALKFAFVDGSKELRNDKDVVLAAVSNNGRALNFASRELKDDKEIVLAAVSSVDPGEALIYTTSNLIRDLDILIEAYLNGFTIPGLPSILRRNLRFEFNELWNNHRDLFIKTQLLTSEQILDAIFNKDLSTIGIQGKYVAKLINEEEYMKVRRSLEELIEGNKSLYAAIYHGPKTHSGIFTDSAELRARGLTLPKVRGITNAYGLTPIRRRIAQYLDYRSTPEIIEFMRSFLSVER